ncbi:pilus assembly protein TadG-related protein [Nocardioides campestrisoli]|uniref:pilus assembly protein TadG-related protein n=1 Tax=Nocardioides campestrisoli TaxID=2736757 RepID=UPI0015E7A8C8|nr:pilus assembly protein TadG-related protein [Nocardioides campestrisoli]
MSTCPRIRDRSSQAGAAAVIMAVFIAALMIPLGAIGVDIARWYVEAERVQAAADAAATAGVTHMPDDFELARDRAIEIAADNGFRTGAGATVTVAKGDKPTQLKVTVSAPVTNQFGQLFGVDTTTMSRTAVADFNGPAPMGSPCNTFGNEPAGSAALGPVASQLKTPLHATCSTNPQLWGSITGPETTKNQGAQFETRKCGGGEDGCSGSTNLDFDPKGFIYMVRVNAAAVGTPVRLQIYDPAYVDTGTSGCNAGPVGDINTSDQYRYPMAITDARNRYDNTANSFCTGDGDNNGNRFGGEVPTITSFALRRPVDTLNPFDGPAHDPARCTKQFPGYSHTTGSGVLSTANLRTSVSPNYKIELARVFHQWVDLCTFVPDQAGDWYLQVRNNVAVPSGSVLDATGAVAGNTRVTSQTGDDTSVKGNGTNSFSLRAISTAPAGAVSVASWERMRIYANANSATTEFNLVRVVPAAANKTLVLSFFDVGEGSSSGSVTVLRPADSNLPSSVAGCVGRGVKDGALSGCQITGITPSKYNGKLQEIQVPIPNTYDCQVSSQGGCWFRVRVSFGTGSVTDATTWTARIVGEPIRLIE